MIQTCLSVEFTKFYGILEESPLIECLPSVVASGRLEVEDAFLDADTFGVLDDAVFVVAVSDLGEVNIDLDEAEGGDDAELRLAS